MRTLQKSEQNVSFDSESLQYIEGGLSVPQFTTSVWNLVRWIGFEQENGTA